MFEKNMIQITVFAVKAATSFKIQTLLSTRNLVVLLVTNCLSLTHYILAVEPLRGGARLCC